MDCELGWKGKDAKIQRAAFFTVAIALWILIQRDAFFTGAIALWILKTVKIHQTARLKYVQIITGQLYPSKAVKQLAKANIYED